MILPTDRKLAQFLFRIKAFYLAPSIWGPQIRARRGFKWLLKRMTKRQTSDGLHHAPACPGNEWSGMALVFRRCNCGARP